MGSCLAKKNPRVIFVLGGPGAGKSTQCKDVAKLIGYTYLSSGDLLRKEGEAKPDTPQRKFIRKGLNEGMIFDSSTMNKVILPAIEIKRSGNDKFLLDGFPRSVENRQRFEAETGIEPELVLYFDCPEEELKRRLLNRGRADDDIQSIEKRLEGFRDTTIPVINYYESIGKVRRIDADKSQEEVFQQVKAILAPKVEEPNRNCLSSLLLYRHNCCAIL